MISLRASEIRELTEDELGRKLAETRQELFNLRFQHATGALDNTAALTRVKRDIARLLTLGGRAQPNREGLMSTENDIEAEEAVRGRRKERRGVVVSDAMDKTIVVRVDVVKSHPKYKKTMRRSIRLHAHDEKGEAKTGDIVRLVETRPLSKTKRWRMAEIVEVAK